MSVMSAQLLCLAGKKKKFDTILDFCVSSLRRGHANLLCIVPILTDDSRRRSEDWVPAHTIYTLGIFDLFCLWAHSQLKSQNKIGKFHGTLKARPSALDLWWRFQTHILWRIYAAMGL